MNSVIQFIIKKTFAILFINKVIFSIFIITILSLLAFNLKAQTTTIPSGSLIIDMGVLPQTYENGLKPYGLVYELIDIIKIPVIWSINPSKVKDGVDFSVDGRDFSGGTFIVKEEYVADSNVQSSIASWKAKGVETYITSSEVTVDVYKVLDIWPQWVVDAANGKIATEYLKLAGIPDNAYRIDLPSGLNICDDLFILPHADPNWTDHGYLYDWINSYDNGGNKGSLWAGCHAVSVLEALVDPLDSSRSMNFLTTDGLIEWTNHDNGSDISYSYDYSNDSYMQFMGTIDGASKGGSEQIFLPTLTSSWRSTTDVSVWDVNQINVLSGDSPGLAAVIAYGPAFGDRLNGNIMYEGGHDLTKKGTIAEKVAAIRAFLNFSFDARTGKAAQFTDNLIIPLIVEGGATISFDVDVFSTKPGESYTFSWTSSCVNGTFTGTSSSSNNTSTNYSTNPVLTPEECIITVLTSDTCGRESYKSYGIKIVPPPSAPVANDDNYTTYDTNSITFNPLKNDVDFNFNINPATLSANTPLSIPGEGRFEINPNGIVTFYPEIGFSGTTTLNYTICDDTSSAEGGPFCDSANISIHVIESDCEPGEEVLIVIDYGTSVISSKDWKNTARALGAPDNQFSKSKKNKGFLVIDLGHDAIIGSQIIFRVFSDKGNSKNGKVDAATSSGGFPNVPVDVLNVTTKDPSTDLIYYEVTELGTRYVKIEGDKDFGLESVEFKYSTCSNSSPNVGGIMISQYYENGKDNDYIEIKNLSNLATKGKEYYLAFYKRRDDTNKAPKKGNHIEVKPMEPGEVRVYNKFKLEGNDIVIISTSKDGNCFNNRVDIIGNQNGSWGNNRSFTKGGCASESSHLSFDINDWVELEVTKVDGSDNRQNIALGTYNLGSINWNGSTWSDNALPDLSRIAIIDSQYNANIGNIESCDLIINSDLNFDSNTTNSIIVYRDLIINGAFTIGDQESLIMYDDNANIIGNITKKESSTYRNSIYDFTYWSSPIENALISSVYAGVTQSRIFLYDQSQSMASDPTDPTYWNTWVIASGTMNPGSGYATEGLTGTTGKQNISFFGKPNNGRILVNIIENNDTDPDNDFNFLGNPYPSAIDIEDFFDLNNSTIDPTIYLWTHNRPISNGDSGDFSIDDYATYNYTGGTGVGGPIPDKNIGSSQGFFIRAVNSGTVEFNNSMRIEDANDQFFKSDKSKNKIDIGSNERDRIWLNLTTDKAGFNQILIGFTEKATEGVDRGYDALKIEGDNSIGFYSIIDNEKYSIQGLNIFSSEKTIDLGFDTKVAPRIFTISIDNMEGVLKNSEIYLVDNLLNITHNLKDSDYQFMVKEVGESFDRFTLQFIGRISLSVDDDFILNNDFIISQDEGLKISSQRSVQSIKVYDILGRILIEDKPNKKSFILETGTINKGTVLIIKAALENSEVITRKTIKL